MRAGPLAPVGPSSRVPVASMFLPWCCGAGKEGIFRWRKPPQHRQELCLRDCLEQLSALLALPQMPGEDAVLDDLHRLLRDVHIQVERAMSQRSPKGVGGSVGSRSTGLCLNGAGVGDISALRGGDACGSACGDPESLCMRCAAVPASLCVTCAQDSIYSGHGSSIVALPAVGGLRAGCLDRKAVPGRSGAATERQGVRNPCRLRPHRPRLRVPVCAALEQSPPSASQTLPSTERVAESKAAFVPSLLDAIADVSRKQPMQFYIGDDEAWRCDDPSDTMPSCSGAAWQSELGLPAPPPGGLLGRSPPKAAHPMAPLWGTQLSTRTGSSLETIEENPAERAQTVATLRRQLHGLSEHSRHLHTVPLTGQATDRDSSSTGGTFREFLHACTSEDMVLIPPSCLEARRRLPEAPHDAGMTEAAIAVTMQGIDNVANGIEPQPPPLKALVPAPAKAKETKDEDTDALLALPPPPPCHADDDEECECERYAVSRQRDGRLIWSPEVLLTAMAG